MPVPQNQRQPKSQVLPERQIKTGGDPENFDKETLAWHFNRLDRSHAQWGWEKLKASQWKDILKHLQSFEGLTWASLKQQAGGKRHGTNHHAIQIEKFTKPARDRVRELHLEEYDTLFSLRISQTLRLYGVRDGRVLKLVWHDPHHGSGKGACPTANSN